jgi:hypothetical protein
MTDTITPDGLPIRQDDFAVVGTANMLIVFAPTTFSH